ncbi:hypothetical protein QOT17_013480 [Balamuthia mandrillaris]
MSSSPKQLGRNTEIVFEGALTDEIATGCDAHRFKLVSWEEVGSQRFVCGGGAAGLRVRCGGNPGKMKTRLQHPFYRASRYPYHDACEVLECEDQPFAFGWFVDQRDATEFAKTMYDCAVGCSAHSSDRKTSK